MDIKLIITNIRPNSLWCLNGNTLDDLVWYPDNTTTKPTLQECLNYWNIHGISYEMIKIREERDKKLLDSDKYTSIPDWPHETEEIRQAWFVYRQALRDLPQTINIQIDENGNFTNFEWPTPPS